MHENNSEPDYRQKASSRQRAASPSGPFSGFRSDNTHGSTLHFCIRFQIPSLRIANHFRFEIVAEMVPLLACALFVATLAANDQQFFDPKEYAFRSIRAYEENQADDADYLEPPQPGGLNVYDAKRTRTRRQVNASEEQLAKENSTVAPQEEALLLLEKPVGKPLELETLGPENETSASTPRIITGGEASAGTLEINDFIRFKRGLELDAKQNGSSNKQEVAERDSRSGKMLLAPEDAVYSGNREPRGATRDYWLKQEYPVRVNPEEPSSSASENVRAPRVHFVTQRRSESAPAPVYRQYNYERNFQEPRGGREYYSRQARHYDPYPAYEPYYRFEEARRFEPKFEPVDRDEGYRQRRIIYYATLPEIVRSPPNVDLRDRYDYRGRYDDRYVTSRPVSVARKAPKPRFEDDRKAAYPVKVSADVHVREVKKNPERRIYSEAERYPFNPEGYERRQ